MIPAGPRVHSVRARLLVLSIALAAAACGPSAHSPAGSAAAVPHPSILLITLDTTRADAIGPQAVGIATPSFNAIALRGRRFRQAYATVPETLPSHSSMMTGLYPAGHGIHENGRFVPPRFPVVAEKLQQAGYRTSAFVSSFSLARRFGLARGFQVYDDALPDGRAERSARQTTDAVLKDLAQQASQPRFVWVHYYEPHYPYDPPEPFRAQYAKTPYLGEIAAMDEQIGRLVGAFERQAMSESRESAILIAADHGEGLGDHGEALHGNLLYQSTMHVPLVIAGPGVASGVSDATVSTRRIYHTILDWAGVDASGSLRQTVDEVVLGEAMKPFLEYGWQPQVMAIAGRSKAILAGPLEVYDVIADPGEARNLGSGANVPSDLRARLEDYPVPSPEAARAPDNLDDEAKRRLASLGYVSAGAAPVVRKDAPRPADMVGLFDAIDAASGLFANGRYADAVPLLERILARDPANLDATLRIATAYSALGNDGRALQAFRRAREIAPRSPDVQLYLALHYAKGKEWPRAVPLLEEVIAGSPERLPALEALADLREREGRLDAAIDLRRKIGSLRPPSPAEQVHMGQLAMRARQTPLAIDSFEAARARQGRAFSHDLELGVLYLAARRLENARQALDRVPPSDPEYPMALFKRAQVSVLLNEPDSAVRIDLARRRADHTTRELIAREKLFSGGSSSSPIERGRRGREYAGTMRARHSGIPFALLGFLLLATRPSAQGRPPAPLPLLTTIQQIRALSQDEGARGYPVRVRGIVTHFDEQAAVGLIVHDGEFGQFVMPPPNPRSVSPWRDLRRGDLVEIEGRTIRGGFAPNVQPALVRRLRRAPLPSPKHIPFSSMLTGRHDCDYVEVTGVVQRAWLSSDPQMHTLFADVAFDDGIVRAAFWDYSRQDLVRFVDARVRLRGNVGALFGRTEQLRGVSLFVGHTGDVVVLESAPDPFALPTRSIRSIYNYSAAGEVNRRIRVRGVVTGYIPGHPVEVTDFTSTAMFRYVQHVLYVDDGTGGARIETEQEQRVRPGDVIEVAGFPVVTPGKPILTNAIFRTTGAAAQPRATGIGADNVLTPENDAMLVRLEGRFLSLLITPMERILVLKVGETVLHADLEADAGTGALERIRPGSTIAVTGVYSYQWGPPPSFRLFLRSPDDVTVLASAPWWTLRHTFVMVVLLGVVAGAAGLWARTTANRKRQEYQAVLNERSRVGRELHDTFEQGLAGIALQLEAVAGSLDASPEAARQSLDVARQMLRYSQEEARRSVMDLRSQALESRDLPGALTDLARQMTYGTSVVADVRVEGPAHRLDASQEHHLLRIGLEALTNALKHSGARRIEIRLRFGADGTELVVQDDGCGLDNRLEDKPGCHFGLQGIRERVDKLRGVLRIDRRPAGGTRLFVGVPARRPAAPAPDRGVLGESWRTS